MNISWTSLLLYLAATAAAQATHQLTELPQCAIGCFQQAVVETTSCNPTDTACLCAGDNTVKIEKRASGCVAANCEDSSEIPGLFKEICSGGLAAEQKDLGEAAPVDDEMPVEGAPVGDTETPVTSSLHEDVEEAEEAPVEEALVEEPPVEEPPVEEPPVEDAPIEEPPVEEAPIEEPPVEGAPIEEPPVEGAPVEETSVV